ncbi:MAG TPA: helix-hairpin-helix domain-containing protein [Burkholderiales bacterium]
MKRIAAVLFCSFLALTAAHAAPVDINTADAKTLDKAMVGVGPKVAQAIVDYRTKNGPFKSVDDLGKVKGVGKQTIEKNRANLTVGKAAGN